MAEDHSNELDYNYSRPLDIHRISDFPEVIAFVDQIWNLVFEAKLSEIKRKHLMVVILDLYVEWRLGTERLIAVSMSPKTYKSKGNRYNALRISSLTIDVVRELEKAGLILFKVGFQAKDSSIGFVSRIWPTSKLIEMFQSSKIEHYMIERPEVEEVIILRGVDKKVMDYVETPETLEMRSVVKDYNRLLKTMFIDIRRLDQPWIEFGEEGRLSVGPNAQRVHRVFNRGDFSMGGRFYGPWWQQCPKQLRREIFINDAPTVEEDYSSLHIALLYAKEGINYYDEFEGDAYKIDKPIFLNTSELCRKYAKLLLLTAVNAKTPKQAYSAFRSNCTEANDNIGKALKNKQLAIILDALKEKHPQIAVYLGSDAGINLMKTDSQITEHVIKTFTARGLPVLTVHDSYIVHWGDAHLLNNLLTEAYQHLTGLKGNIRSERIGVVLDDPVSWKNEQLSLEAITPTTGYINRMIDWMAYRRNGNSLNLEYVNEGLHG
jgi:hypothetical protein